MDTLPTDLLLLIDKHASYAEETLVFNISTYDGPTKNLNSWKCILHHLHRQYDKYDDLFIDEYIEFKILMEYIIPRNDLIGCIHLVNKINTTETHTQLLEKSIQKQEHIAIFKYLYEKFEISSQAIGTIRQLFISACSIFNRKVCDFLIDKVQPESMPYASKLNDYGLFKFCLLHHDDPKWLKFIFDHFSENRIIGMINSLICEVNRINFSDWIFKIADNLEKDTILYALLDNLLIEDAVLFTAKYTTLGANNVILFDYLQYKYECKSSGPIPDVLRAYYDKGLINLDQLSALYKSMLDLPKFVFRSLDSYKLLVDTLTLTPEFANKIFKLCIGDNNIDVLEYMLTTKTFQYDKYIFSSLPGNLSDKTIVLLFEHECILYNSADDVAGCYYIPKLFKLLSNQLSSNATIEEWICDIINKSANVDREFIDYVCIKYPNLDYQKILDVIIGNSRIYGGQRGKIGEIISYFIQNDIVLNYKRLLNISRGHGHVDIAIMLHSRMNK